MLLRLFLIAMSTGGRPPNVDPNRLLKQLNLPVPFKLDNYPFYPIYFLKLSGIFLEITDLGRDLIGAGLTLCCWRGRQRHLRVLMFAMQQGGGLGAVDLYWGMEKSHNRAGQTRSSMAGSVHIQGSAASRGARRAMAQAACHRRLHLR
jgi:hypothetical protein